MSMVTDNQLKVISMRFADLILRIGAESENGAKVLLIQSKIALKKKSNFPEVAKALCTKFNFQKARVDIIWPYQELSQPFLTPFSSWSSSASNNPKWYNAYHDIKHDRHNNFSCASYGNTLDRLAALFILNLLLRKDEIESKSD
jgi:hypothetical protein